MFLGFEDSLKEWKKDLKVSGVDMSMIKSWQKAYDKVKRQTPVLENQYIKAKKDLKTVYALLLDMEKALVECKGCDTSLWQGEAGKTVVSLANSMKQYQNSFNQEFLISKEDTEFHLTYKSILDLCAKREQDSLILQSEVENLMALTKEALDKNWPDFRAMAFFYLERSDKEIFDIPHADKVEKVTRVFENECLKPMRQMMTQCYGEEKAKQIVEVDLWN